MKRLERITEEMEQQGYTRKNLTISMGKATAFSLLLLIAFFIVGQIFYYIVNHDLGFGRLNTLVFLISMAALIVAHELVHGVFWSIFTPNHFKDIEFGIMKPSMSPYCTCLEPLKKGQYIIGAVMPLIIVGIIPMIIGIVLKNPTVLFMGVIMSSGAAGDIMIIRKILGYKTDAKETVYMDHPTEAGGLVFER